MLNGDQNWTVVTADGVRHTSGFEAFACAPASSKNLGSLKPSITVKGTIYVDAPKDLNGAVVVLSPPLNQDESSIGTAVSATISRRTRPCGRSRAVRSGWRRRCLASSAFPHGMPPK